MPRSLLRGPFFLVTTAVVSVILAACAGGGAEEAVTTTQTLALSEFPPETCVQQGWEQEPLLAETLAVDPAIPIESLPDVEQLRAMDIVVGCFDRDTLVQAFDAIQTPFDFPPASAECLADGMINNQSGAAFLGFGSYTNDTAPTLTEVDLRTDTVAILEACVPPTAWAYGVAVAPYFANGQNAAVDTPCVDRNYLESLDTAEFWGASYDQIVGDQNIEPINRILFEPALVCVSYGQAYAASVKGDSGEDLSASTVACMDNQLAQTGAVDQFIATGSNQDLIDAAALACLTDEERITFGLPVDE